MTLEWGRAERLEWATGPATAWASACGGYRVVALTHGYGAERRQGGRWESVEADPRRGPGYPRYYDTKGDARRAAEAHHASRPPGGNGATTMSDDSIFVQRAAAVALFEELGFEAAPAWTDDRLLGKISKIPDIEAGGECPRTESGRDLFHACAQAVRGGRPVRLITESEGTAMDESVDAAAVVATAKPKKGGKAKGAAKAGKAKAAAGAAGGTAVKEKAARVKAPAKEKAAKPTGSWEREYRGKTYKVTGDGQAFHCGGKSYKSLTAAAKAITGQNSINGRAFFGM